MEAVKTPRRNSFLTVAVTVNILFSAVSIAFLIYKVRVLEEHVLQLQDDQRYHAEATKENERADELLISLRIHSRKNGQISHV